VQLIQRLQSKGLTPDSDAYCSVLRVCSRSSMYLQAMCNFSFARSLLEHIIGIHAGMVSADIPISHGAALIAASAQQVFIFAVSQKFPVFLSMKFAFFGFYTL
jgi:hypothetical protein